MPRKVPAKRKLYEITALPRDVEQPVNRKRMRKNMTDANSNDLSKDEEKINTRS